MNRKQGLIKLIVVIVAIIVILSFLNVNIRGLFSSETMRDNFSYIGSLIERGWDGLKGLFNK